MGEPLRHNLIQVEILADFSEKKNCTPAQPATAWVLVQAKDIVLPIGTSKRDRLQENLGSPDVLLSPVDLASMDPAFPEGNFQCDRYQSVAMHAVAGFLDQLGLVVKPSRSYAMGKCLSNRC